MAVNGAVTAVAFDYVVTAPVEWVHRINVELAAPTILAGDFGGRAALTRGLTIKYHDSDDAELLDFTDGLPILTNAGFAPLAGVDITRDVQTGNAADTMTVRWTIAKSGGPLKMVTGQYIRFMIQDDQTAQTVFRAMAQGVNRL
jgi:hypothetical protein